MTSRQSKQVKSWVIYATALIFTLICFYLDFYIGLGIAFAIICLSLPLRDGHEEWEYFTEFSKQYPYLVYASIGLMFIQVGYLIYSAAAYRLRVTLEDALLPLLAFLPIIIFFEYKLFKKNA